MQSSWKSFSVKMTDPFIRLLNLLQNDQTTAVPVVDDEDSYLATVQIHDLMAWLSTQSVVAQPGGLLSLKVAHNNYSLSEIARIAEEGVGDEELARVKTRMLADWNNGMESFLGRADNLARLQAIWGDAAVANQIPGWIQAVDSDDIKRVASTYLTAENRTVIDRKPAAMLEAAANDTGKE